MRYHLLARKTRSLLKSLPKYPRAQLSSTQALRYPRKDRPSTQPIPRFSRRAISSETPAQDHPESTGGAAAAAASPSAEDPPPSEDVEEKPKRRTRVSSVAVAPKPEADSVALPSNLDILWTPEDVPDDPSSSSVPSTTLPPPEIFNEVLHNLHIVLHPQTQNRAAYSSGGAPLVEPTLALYCPIEGGDFVLDATVREMARRTGADVVVLDAVQLAAGECGHFGKAASVLQLPNNPLQFPSSQREPTRPNSQRENEEDDEQPSSGFSMSPMTVHVMASMPRRPYRLTEPPRSMPMARLKGFFDEIVNLRPASTGDGEEPSSLPARRPRIIYVRDYPTLAASSSAWYPALLAAVRQRRQGPISRPNSPVVNPTAIVFGITPSFMVPEPLSSTPSPGLQGVNLVSSKSPDSQQTSSNLKSSHKPEFGEDSGSEKAREKRVQRRLKRWARGISEDVPRLHPANEDMHDSDGSRGRPSVVVLGQEGFSGLSPFLGHSLSRALAGRSQGTPESDNRLGFFRASLVFPTLRSLPQERDARMSRRREVNQLAMRMAVAQVGGILGELEDVPEPEQSALDGDDHDRAKAQLWERWGQTVEVWPNVQRIADRAVGGVVAASQAYLPSNRSLEPTPVPWPAVFDAWAADRSSQDMWKTLFSTPPSGKLHRENEEEERAEVEDEADVDEIIEKLRRNPDLDEHEQRLLGCIVDTASITTTFNQVHLPPHTIDSIRTMVSLPLLHPSAFQQGILKEHSMTGCLLFGPPGTGKTLVVRALAKEAGCRMLVVSPSDIMDMYVGEGEKLVRAVFSLARRLSPCVVFVDELDALFGARLSRESGSSLAHRGVITEFMQEMDGLKSSKESNVIVIGATNRPFDLDDAVLRRLPRRLLVDLPGEKERAEILKILLRDETLADDVDLQVLAQKTESFSGSDLKHLCVSAALDAVKERVTVPWRPPPPGAQPVALAAKSEAAAVSTFASTETAPEPEPPAVEATAEKPAGASSAASQEEGAASEAPYARSLYWRNFEQALKEITPSASEALGTLSELRKWNDEFGEGRRAKKRQVWGKDRFGFTVPAVVEAVPPLEVNVEPAPVAANTSTTSPEAAARG